jgi:hypothetical protein
VAEGLEEVHATLSSSTGKVQAVDEIASMGLSGRAIAKMVGVSEATVRRIVRGDRPSALSPHLRVASPRVYGPFALASGVPVDAVRKLRVRKSCSCELLR